MDFSKRSLKHISSENLLFVEKSKVCRRGTTCPDFGPLGHTNLWNTPGDSHSPSVIHRGQKHDWLPHPVSCSWNFVNLSECSHLAIANIFNCLFTVLCKKRNGQGLGLCGELSQASVKSYTKQNRTSPYCSAWDMIHSSFLWLFSLGPKIDAQSWKTWTQCLFCSLTPAGKDGAKKGSSSFVLMLLDHYW